MFREVTLPNGVTGRLLLHSMPGRNEPIESTWAAAKQEKIDAVVRLADLEEVASKSPTYCAALQADRVPFPVLQCDTPDYGVPSDRDAFWSLSQEITSRLRAGQVILFHCGAGVGRTGTFPTCVLLALGQEVDIARGAVAKAGSRPETSEQSALIKWCVSQG